jgi:hypothetical protein
VEIFKVIHHPKFRWIWTKLYDVPWNLSYWKKTLKCAWKAMKSCKALNEFRFQKYAVGICAWSSWSYFNVFCVRLDVQWSNTHCKGSWKTMFGANIEDLSLKGSQFSCECDAKSLNPIGSHHILHSNIFPIDYLAIIPLHYVLKSHSYCHGD